MGSLVNKLKWEVGPLWHVSLPAEVSYLSCFAISVLAQSLSGFAEGAQGFLFICVLRLHLMLTSWAAWWIESRVSTLVFQTPEPFLCSFADLLSSFLPLPIISQIQNNASLTFYFLLSTLGDFGTQWIKIGSNKQMFLCDYSSYSSVYILLWGHLSIPLA